MEEFLQIVHARGAIPTEVGPTRCVAMPAFSRLEEEKRRGRSRRGGGGEWGEMRSCVCACTHTCAAQNWGWRTEHQTWAVLPRLQAEASCWLFTQVGSGRQRVLEGPYCIIMSVHFLIITLLSAYPC